MSWDVDEPYLTCLFWIGNANEEQPLWTPLWVNSTNIFGELPHSPGILMNKFTS